MDSPIIWTIIIALVSLTFTFGRAWYIWWRIEQSGVVTQARIIELRKAYRNKKIVTYEYNVSMTHYQKTVQVGGHTFSRLLQADSIDIKYLPQTPQTSVIVGDNTELYALTLSLLILLVGGVALLFSSRK